MYNHHMLELANNTDLSANIYSGHNHEAQEQFTAVVKASFSFTPDGEVTSIAAAPIQDSDEWRDKPHYSSLKASSETMPFKDGAEILLSGTVHPPENPYHVMNVMLGLRTEKVQWQKQLRLFGNRRWQKYGLRYKASHPELLTPIDLIYENSFGGVCPYRSDQSYSANPAGKGFLTREKECESVHLPNIEYADKLLEKPSQQVLPAGFGAIPLQWAPRTPKFKKEQFASLDGGRYPENLTLPLNFYNVAPLDQRFKEKLVGGEIIKLGGLTKNVDLSKTVELIIPTVKLHGELSTQLNHKINFTCDTLSIDIDTQQFHLIWRAAVPAELIKKSAWLKLDKID